jgi:hypothetical protein
MSQYQGDEMDHVVDDYEIAEVDDDVYFHGRFMADSESEDDDDDDEYDHLVCSIHTSVSTFFLLFLPLMWNGSFVVHYIIWHSCF